MKAGCVLGIQIVNHQTPAVFLRSFEGSYRCIIAYGGQEGFNRNDKSVAAVLGVNSQAVHLLVDFQKIGTSCRKESFYISHQTSVLAEVIFIAVNVLPACYWIGILKVILVVFLPQPV